MSLGTDLLQEWLHLRSTTRSERDFWNGHAHNLMISQMMRGDNQPEKISENTTKMGLIESTVGKGTSVGIPYDLLTKRQQRETRRFMKGDLRVDPEAVEDVAKHHPNPDFAETARVAPSLILADQLTGGQLLGGGPTPFDIDILGRISNISATVAENCTLYFWATDPLCAVLEASKSLPPESAIIADLYTELPRCGLWIFETPIKEQTTTADFEVGGLLWDLQAEGLWLRSLVRVRPETQEHYPHQRVGMLAGTWQGWFPANLPLKDLEAAARQGYRESYADEHRMTQTAQQPARMGEDRSVGTNMLFAQLWLAAVQWMQQRILVRHRPQSVLPKNKKRARKFSRDLKGQMPTIEIVQLRRSAHSATHGTGTGRSYTMRFVVHGHWRNQWYATKGVHAPKWIESYVKGPADKPLKESLRVYAVTR